MQGGTSTRTHGDDIREQLQARRARLNDERRRTRERARTLIGRTRVTLASSHDAVTSCDELLLRDAVLRATRSEILPPLPGGTSAENAVSAALTHRHVQIRHRDIQIRDRDVQLRDRDVQLRQKDILLKEINHRVKNNLQTVSSLLALQMRRMTDEQAGMALRDARMRVEVVARIHQRLYQTDDISRLSLDEYLAPLCRDIVRAHATGIELDLRFSPMRVSLDVAMPLALAVNELVTNAIKYAYPDGAGQISVVLGPSNRGGGELRVVDRGVGPPDGSRPRGLGLRLVEGWAQQIGGSFTIEPAMPGTRACVSWHEMAAR